MGYHQHDLVWKVRHFVDASGMITSNPRLVVGVSGGADSLCLLHVMRQLAPGYGLALHVAHLNHQLRGDESDQDADFVARLAGEWGLPHSIETRNVSDYARHNRLAIEEAARQCRYGFLVEVASRVAAEAIAVGHNADDQAESVLMHFIRGSGLAGLRGMLPVTPLGEMRLAAGSPPGQAQLEARAARLKLVRPLLETPRDQIEAYCQQHGLQARFDRSNLDTTYFRNWLRHDLLPMMATHNPGISEVLGRTASIAADDYAWLHATAQQAWSSVVQTESEQVITFDLAGWRALHVSLQRAVLREAVHRLRHTLRNINFVHIETARQVAAGGSTGHQATLPAGLLLDLSYATFTVASPDPALSMPDQPWLEAGHVLNLITPGLTPLPNSDWALAAKITARAAHPAVGPDIETSDVWEAYLDADSLEQPLALRTRQAGDRLAPLGMDGHTKALRDVFIHAKIPQAWRDRVPILVCGPHVMWVCGVQPSHHGRVTPGTQRVLHLRFVNMATTQLC